MSYITITAGFSASGEEVLSYAKSMPLLPVSKIAWKNTFREIAYNVIPNRRYADSAVMKGLKQP